MIDTHSLTKRFGPHEALIEIDLHIGAGERVILVGPNGAGKTTLLRMLAGLTRPTSGRIHLAGIELDRMNPTVRRHVGYLSHRSLLYDDLTVEQNLAFYARLYSVSDSEARIEVLLDQFDLSVRRHHLVRTLSRGMKQRLAIARAVLHRPSLLLLDEPYTGLDPLATDLLNVHLRELSARGCTIVMSTHRLDAPALIRTGQRMVVLNRGRMVFDGPYDDTFVDRYRALITGESPSNSASRSLDHTVDSSPRDIEVKPVLQRQAGIGKQVWAIASKDLAAELHTREIISAMFVFAVLALFTFSFALDLRGALARAAAPGVLWSTVAFTGILGLSRSLVREYQTGGIEGLLAAPVDLTAVFFGKALSTWILMMLVEAVLVPLTTVFLNVPLFDARIGVVLLLGTLGYAAVGTLLSAIAVNTRAREVMLPILLLPIAVPLFLAAVQTTQGLLEGASWTELSGWTRLLIVYDLIIVAISMVMFRYTLEE